MLSRDVVVSNVFRYLFESVRETRKERIGSHKIRRDGKGRKRVRDTRVPAKQRPSVVRLRRTDTENKQTGNLYRFCSGSYNSRTSHVLRYQSPPPRPARIPINLRYCYTIGVLFIFTVLSRPSSAAFPVCFRLLLIENNARASASG